MKCVRISIVILFVSCSALAQDIKDMNWGQLQTNCVREIEAGQYTSLKKIKVEEFKILAWYRMRDDRPVYVDSALCWAKVSTKKGIKWALVVMVRKPMFQEDSIEQAWHIAIVLDRENYYFLYYDAPPKSVDVYRMDFFAPFRTRDFKFYDSKIIEDNWESAIGEKPDGKIISRLLPQSSQKWNPTHQP